MNKIQEKLQELSDTLKKCNLQEDLENGCVLVVACIPNDKDTICQVNLMAGSHSSIAAGLSLAIRNRPVLADIMKTAIANEPLAKAIENLPNELLEEMINALKK